MNEDEIPELVRSIALKSNSEQVAINAFKLSMINFDYDLFDTNYDEILQHHDFQHVFMNVFMPLMRELEFYGRQVPYLLLMSIFITNLIKQKIHLQSEALQRQKPKRTDHPLFVLFLPENEIHELGILYLNYLILNSGFKTVFLGQSLQTSSLETLQLQHQILFYFLSHC